MRSHTRPSETLSFEEKYHFKIGFFINNLGNDHFVKNHFVESYKVDQMTLPQKPKVGVRPLTK
jgi:hypothetical protein